MGAAIPQVVSEDRAAGALIVDGGLRFDGSKSQRLERTFGTPTDNDLFTWSFWVKLGGPITNSSDYRVLVEAYTGSSDQYNSIAIQNGNIIFNQDQGSGGTIGETTNAKYRDTAWYNIVVSVDVSNGAASNRLKIYVNGNEQSYTPGNTISGEIPYINKASTAHRIGARWNLGSTGFYDGLMSQVYFIDGQALGPEYFGYTDPLTNTWRPKKLDITKTPGGSYGTNGFYLPFDGSAPIGQDQSGRGNNWTPVNFGGSNTIEKATGALPILNTDGGGKVARVGVRTDANASSLVLALPLVGIKSDFSNAINSGTSNKAVTENGGIVASSAQSNFYGGSYAFDGSNDYLTVGTNTDWTFLHNGSSWTVEFWVYATSTYGYLGRGYIFANTQGGISGAETGFAFWCSSSAILVSAPNGNPGSTQINLSYSYVLPANKWTHLAATFDGSTCRLFIDGVLSATDSASSFSASTSTNTLNIGRTTDSYYFNDGYMQDLRIYNGLIKYTSNFIPASTDPDIVPDSPSGVSYSSNVALVPSTDGAVAFDGSGDYLSLTDTNNDLDLGGLQASVEFFVYVTDLSATRVILNKGGGDGASAWNTTNGLEWTFVYISGGAFYFQYNNAGSPVSITGSLSLGVWTHVAAATDASNNISLFINGLKVGTATNAVTKPSSRTLIRIGQDWVSQTHSGHISNVHFIKGSGAYDPTATTITVPSAPISSVENTKLLCCKSQSSATAADVTPGTITANGNAAASNFNPFTVNINTQRGKQSGYATLNPTVGATQLGGSTAPTYSDGNTKVSFNGAAPAAGTIGVISGKWYFEVLVNSAASTNNSTGFGIRNGLNAGAYTDFTGYFRGVRHNNSGNLTYSTSGDTGTSAGSVMAAGEVYGIAYDVDNNFFGLYKNGVVLASSSSSSLSGGTWFPYAFGDSASGSHTFNFGQKPFKFPPPAGFQPLTLANTPRPTIVRPDQYVGVTTYTGNGAARSINVGFKPDFVWIKSRTPSAYNHRLLDTVRGATKELYSSETTEETTQSQSLTSFNRDGFSLGTLAQVNENNTSFVAWAWKAGGNSNTFNVNDVGYATASAAGLTAGTITPTGASVNTKSGFSIITYTISSASSSISTFSHGLNNTPSFAIFKVRNANDTWTVYHSGISNPTSNWLTLNATDAAGGNTSTFSASNTTFGIRETRLVGTGSSGNVVAYLWAEIPGFSKFGSYTGNGSADGPFCWTGMRPRWVMIKRTDSSTNADWRIFDTSRDAYNVSQNILYANLSDANDTGAGAIFDILSNGFKMRNTYAGLNASAGTYIYAAWAESPSFNLYGAQANAR
jgi:hypothetical protein